MIFFIIIKYFSRKYFDGAVYTLTELFITVHSMFGCYVQAVALFLLSSYYTLFTGASYVAVIALLLYVGSYQVFT
jgi:hypothetical protein